MGLSQSTGESERSRSNPGLWPHRPAAHSSIPSMCTAATWAVGSAGDPSNAHTSAHRWPPPLSHAQPSPSNWPPCSHFPFTCLYATAVTLKTPAEHSPTTSLGSYSKTHGP